MATTSTPHHARAASPTLPAQTPTTDFALLEAQKENIRPLASGRSAATLSSVFAAKSNEVDEKVNREDERFRRDIEEAEKKDREGEEVDGYGDLLDVYNQCVSLDDCGGELTTGISCLSSSTTRLPLLTSCLSWNIPPGGSSMILGIVRISAISRCGACTRGM